MKNVNRSKKNNTNNENPDTRGLKPTKVDGVQVGYMDMIHGKGGEGIPGLVATRHELMLLAKDWWGVILRNDYFAWLHEGLYINRQSAYAYRRLNRIVKLIGNDAVDLAFDDAQFEYGEKQNPADWNLFLDNNAEEEHTEVN
ncbi:MAG: hypothetical protein GY845_21300 [Planctomycetes bacterium]|nr:hypothetical protein [Planctomycetota bacterium]